MLIMLALRPGLGSRVWRAESFIGSSGRELSEDSAGKWDPRGGFQRSGSSEEFALPSADEDGDQTGRSESVLERDLAMPRKADSMSPEIAKGVHALPAPPIGALQARPLQGPGPQSAQSPLGSGNARKLGPRDAHLFMFDRHPPTLQLCRPVKPFSNPHSALHFLFRIDFAPFFTNPTLLDPEGAQFTVLLLQSNF